MYELAHTRQPSGAHESLLKDSAKFKAVLNYHIVSGYLLAKDVKPGEIMTLHGSTLTAVVSSADVRVNGARIRKPTWLRRTVSFTPSTRSFCPRTGNYWRSPPDKLPIAQHLGALEGPASGAFIFAYGSPLVASRGAIVPPSSSQVSNCSACSFAAAARDKRWHSALVGVLHRRCNCSASRFELLRALWSCMSVPWLRRQTRSKTAQRTDTSMITTHS